MANREVGAQRRELARSIKERLAGAPAAASTPLPTLGESIQDMPVPQPQAASVPVVTAPAPAAVAPVAALPVAPTLTAPVAAPVAAASPMTEIAAEPVPPAPVAPVPSISTAANNVKVGAIRKPVATPTVVGGTGGGLSFSYAGGRSLADRFR